MRIGYFHDDDIFMPATTRIHFVFAFLFKFVNPAED